LLVFRPDLRLDPDRVVALPDLCVAVCVVVEDVFFFFFLAAVVLVELLWPDAAYDAGEPEATRAAARISALRNREVGEFCALIYPL
jgi:hypothetical protein